MFFDSQEEHLTLGGRPTKAQLIPLIKNDEHLDGFKKTSLLTMLNSPNMFEHLFAGAAGMALMYAITKYMELSKPARTLLSLAGYGIGNIIYNASQDQKFTRYNPETQRVKLLI